MSKSNHKQPALPCPPYTHPLPKPLADILRHRYGERYTRYNAFRYLLEKQALHLWAGGPADEIPLCVTISALAREWKWHRHSVTDFLGKLRDTGVITLKKSGGYFRIFFPKLELAPQLDPSFPPPVDY